MAGLYIPNDWNGTDYTIIAIEVPDSPYWRATVKGCLLDLSKEWVWDETTGNAESAIEIGQAVFDSASYEIDGGGP